MNKTTTKIIKKTGAFSVEQGVETIFDRVNPITRYLNIMTILAGVVGGFGFIVFVWLYPDTWWFENLFGFLGWIITGLSVVVLYGIAKAKKRIDIPIDKLKHGITKTILQFVHVVANKKNKTHEHNK